MKEIITRIIDTLIYHTESAPKMFGIVHLSVLFSIIVISIILIRLSWRNEDKFLYYTYLIGGIIIILGELYKQATLNLSSSTYDSKYNWYFFPFQFCSTPLYTYLLCIILKKGKLYDVISFYNATYCLIAGTTVMLFPSTVLSTDLGTTIQSLLHHSVMVITGILALKVYAKQFNYLNFFLNFCVFAFMLLIAELLNFGIPSLTGQKVNMFFIAKTDLNVGVAVFEEARKALPYPCFVGLYTLIYTELTVVLSYFSYLITRPKRNTLFDL